MHPKYYKANISIHSNNLSSFVKVADGQPMSFVKETDVQSEEEDSVDVKAADGQSEEEGSLDVDVRARSGLLVCVLCRFVAS
jgi:hypothetical protein